MSQVNKEERIHCSFIRDAQGIPSVENHVQCPVAEVWHGIEHSSRKYSEEGALISLWCYACGLADAIHVYVLLMGLPHIRSDGYKRSAHP